MVGDSAVKIVNLNKSYRNSVALNNVSLNIKKNIIYGLLGSNGAGKTTLIHILMGLLNYDSGDVSILDLDIKKNRQVLKQKVAIVPQKISLYDDLTIYENLFLFGKAYGYKKISSIELKNNVKNHLAIHARNDWVITNPEIKCNGVESLLVSGGHHPLAHSPKRLRIVRDYFSDSVM